MLIKLPHNPPSAVAALLQTDRGTNTKNAASVTDKLSGLSVADAPKVTK